MNVDIKICGITNLSSVKIAADNNIRSLGFVSNNLPGPNTCNDDEIKKMIIECNYYNINSVLLTRHHTPKLYLALILLKKKILHLLNLFLIS